MKLSSEVSTAGVADNNIVNASDSDFNFILNHSYDLAGIY